MNDLIESKSISVAGDKALAKLLNVHFKTVESWRKLKKITAKPLGQRSNGDPLLYVYRWPDVTNEVRRNCRYYKVQKHIDEM